MIRWGELSETSKVGIVVALIPILFSVVAFFVKPLFEDLNNTDGVKNTTSGDISPIIHGTEGDIVINIGYKNDK